MKLLIERYEYKQHEVGSPVYAALHGSSIVNDSELESSEPISLDYVGYFYNRECDDIVFILPKVVLTRLKTKDSQGNPINKTVFDHTPEELLDYEKCFGKNDKEIPKFLSELSIWIYRAINIYREHNPNTKILKFTEYSNESEDAHKIKFHTIFDVILALRDFNKENKDFITFITKYNHSGNRKVNWNKTISKNQVFFQDNTPLYLNPIRKRKEVNFDEELIIIYYSILNHIKKQYGFPLEINFNYPIITGSQFKSYCDNGKGIRKLKSIKYKYFSDKLLRLWNLCYAFFDQFYSLTIKRKTKDYLLTRSFHIIFENMIEELLGDKDLDRGLKDQKDNKRVDHMFIYDSLIKSDGEKVNPNTYYICDSKYYSREEIKHTGIETIENCKKDKEEFSLGIHLEESSIYKQFTYARNVIQWNLNLFFKKTDLKHPQLRPDSLTEGYNIIPNFFISAYIPAKNPDNNYKSYDFQNPYLEPQKTVELNFHYQNRLFDRDTLLLSYFDVNFLFIVSLYGRDNRYQQNKWKAEVRAEFRRIAQQQLLQLYDFYLLKPKEYGWKDVIKFYFFDLNGKLYRPTESSDFVILALEKSEIAKKVYQEESSSFEIHFKNQKDKVMIELKNSFEIIPISNLDNISELNPTPVYKKKLLSLKDELLIIWIEKNEILEWIKKSHKVVIPIKNYGELNKYGILPSQNFENIKYIVLYEGLVTNPKNIIQYKIAPETFPEIINSQKLIEQDYPFIGESTSDEYVEYNIEDNSGPNIIDLVELKKIISETENPTIPIRL